MNLQRILKVKVLVSILALTVAPFGSINTAVAAGNPVWDLTTNFDITYTCTSGCSGDYSHRAMISSQNNTTGDFSGTGYYIPNSSISWDITGNTMANTVAFTVVYNNVNPGYTINATGTIDDAGNLSGTATGPGQTFNWKTTKGKSKEIVGNGMKPAECTGTYDNVIHGTNGKDNIKGTPGNDLIFAYGGNDKVQGGAGNDCIVGGLGNDKLLGGANDDLLFGQGGNDTLKGDSGNDDLFGGSGKDKLLGGAADDRLAGGDDNDTLRGNAGNDLLDGDGGVDTAKGDSGIDTCTAETVKNCEL